MKLQSAKKSIYKKIADLREDNYSLKESSARLIEILEQAQQVKVNAMKRVLVSEEKARKFDELKAILAS